MGSAVEMTIRAKRGRAAREGGRAEIKRMQQLAGLLNENINDGSSLNPRTKVIVDKLLTKTREAIDAKDKDTLQKIYNKALTVGGGSWDYFIDQLTDKGLASITPRGMLSWNFENPEGVDNF